MTDQAQQLETIDPYNVPETLCIGRFNIAITGAFATLTFTHERPDPTALLAEGRIDVKAIVRARIVTTVDNLHALRDLLVNLTQSSVTPAPATGGLNTPLIFLVELGSRRQLRERFQEVIFVNIGFGNECSKILLYQPHRS